jgi:hypothetical protein
MMDVVVLVIGIQVGKQVVVSELVHTYLLDELDLGMIQIVVAMKT